MTMWTNVRRSCAAFISACIGVSALISVGSDAAFAQRPSTSAAGKIFPAQYTLSPRRTTPTPGDRTPTSGGRTPGGSGGGSGLSVPGGAGIGMGILGVINKPKSKPPSRTPPPRTAPPKQVKKKPVKRKRTVRRPPKQRRAAPPALATIPQFLPNEVLVLMAPNQPDTADDALAQTFNLTRLESNEISVLNARIVRFSYSDNRPLPQVIAEVAAHPSVENAQPNNWHLAAGARKKKKTARQYALTKLDIARAHEMAQGQGVPIAVIDTGVDGTHPTLAKSIDKSFDAVGEGKPKAQNHGTAIAGVIAGKGQVKGVAPMARLLAARAFYMHRVYKWPMTTSMILLKAIDWSHANGARVFNMSFAGPYDPLVKKALERIHKSGAILVAAAGNGGPKAPPAYPAAYANVIAITAHDAKDKPYPHANRGNYLAVAAPGVNVFVPKLKKAYGYTSGTSIAAAHVSGIAALLLEQHPDATLGTGFAND